MDRRTLLRLLLAPAAASLAGVQWLSKPLRRWTSREFTLTGGPLVRPRYQWREYSAPIVLDKATAEALFGYQQELNRVFNEVNGRLYAMLQVDKADDRASEGILSGKV